MSLIPTAEPLPLRVDETGAIRVGATRVTLETVVAAFQRGATPEQIAHEYPTLALADIYGAISYYLHHQPEMDAYLKQRRAEAEGIREQVQQRFDPQGIRDRLLARRAERTGD